MNEDDGLAFGEEIVDGPFDGVLACFVLVNGDGDEVIPSTPSAHVRILCSWKPHFQVFHAHTQVIVSCVIWFLVLFFAFS